MNENITKNEIFNDGKTIHLYFNGMIGLYVAYGISAYLLCRHAKATPSYSDDMQMPVAVMNAEHYEELAKQLELLNTVGNHRCLVARETTDMGEYKEWAGQLRESAALCG